MKRTIETECEAAKTWLIARGLKAPWAGNWRLARVILGEACVSLLWIEGNVALYEHRVRADIMAAIYAKLEVRS